MRGLYGISAVAATLSMAVLVGCSSSKPSGQTTKPPEQPPQPAERAITVYAAASLKNAFTEIGQQFKTDNPGAQVSFDFAGSSDLAEQIVQGAPGDVFASADTAMMDKVSKAGLVAGNQVNFASNTLVIVTAPNNPKHIGSFADLTQPGLLVVVCVNPVPCGAATQRIEDSTGKQLHPVSEEPTVTDVLNKVTSGQADAGLVYITDAQGAGGKVTTLHFPEAPSAVNTYPIAVLKNSKQTALSQKFVDLVTGETGQKILSQDGFAKP
ncbi:MAG TPA: molybdate ABC transporter substrate-binding protein [Mycobacterium sp.]|nr:molybdate ABC transporter substrate-binding protein [Mycobacterium sp.]